ncbi:MAG: response regulator, partial [Bacteroidota bacterium]
TKKHYTILYVDDEETNLRIFRTAFKRDYQILLATSGQEAINLLRSNHVQLLITDQKMPEMTGTELLEAIMPEFPDIIRIILTGFSDIEAIVRAVNRSGIYKYITKPWDRGEMKLTIDKALETYELKNDKQKLINELKEANEQLEEKVRLRTKELAQAYERVKDSIRYAQRIQKAMLPKKDKFEQCFKEHFVLYKPKDVVSGDFYWLAHKKEHENNKIVVATVDCTGHGVPGAFMSMIGESLLNHAVHDKEEHFPNEILSFMNQGVKSHLQQGETQNRDGMDASIVTIDFVANKFYFAAAHQKIIYIQNGEMKELKGDNLPIGGQMKRVEDEKYTLHTLPLEGIEAFYLFSDGFQDQFGGPEDRKFTFNLLKEKLMETYEKGLSSQKGELENILTKWMPKEGTQTDDITLVGCKV